MNRIDIKPLTVNKCWQGKRYKTDKYASYEKELLLRLKPLRLPEPPYSLQITFGVSSKLADIDNPLKPFIDVLQKKYGFNDKDIFELRVTKKIVKEKEEFIEFEINSFCDKSPEN